ncbi:hypothetical protein MRX96_017302 [Rhipicephalus microplus]
MVQLPTRSQQALAVLDAYFAPPEGAFCVRTRFRRRVQEPDETTVQFILALQQLAKKCDFGAAEETIVQDHVLHGLRDPDLLRSFVQMGGRFHCKAALEHATEEESVDRALQQLAALQADWITRREHQRRDIHLP